MADAAAKQFSIDGSGDTLIPDLKTMFSFFRTRRTKIFLYGFMFTFFACTLFLAFSPSTGNNSSSPWFSNIFSSSSQSDYRSHFSSFFSHFFPNSSFMPSLPSGSHGLSGNQTVGIPLSSSTSMKMNQTVNGLSPKSPKEEEKQSVVKQKNGNFTSGVVESKPSEKQKEKKTENIEDKSNSSVGVLESKPLEKKTGKALDKKEEKSKGSSGVTESMPSEKKTENLFDSLMNCNIFDGRWVKDDSYPLYASGSCPHIDEPFNCYLNGRPDADYQKLRWKPNGCNVPRLDGKKMLELLRGKRLVFIGDSLNRNMWESLVCILRNSVEDKSKVFEASGRIEFRTEGSYSFVFQDYNCSVEFFRSPFLVQEWEMPESNGTKKETLRLDLVESSSSKYRNADVIVFNTGHWWTHEKTSKGKNYYQEGDHVYGKLNVVDAFHKALLTWARWVDANVNPSKTTVFFRGYSASHFRGGRWNSGGQCDSETQPIKNETYLASYPSKMKILEDVMNDMKTPVFYLNITRLTDYRKDAHPSIYRKQKLSEEERRSPLRYQDCSHWCLPGVPDVWNELLYAQLLIKQHDKNHRPQQFQPQQQQQKGH